MNKKNTISNLQLQALIITTLIGTGILSMPRLLANEVGTSGWISIIVSGIVVIFYFLMFNSLFKLMPGKDIFQIGDHIFPGFIFKIIKIFLIAYYILICSTIIRTFSEVVKTYLLEQTPIEVLIISLLLASIYVARNKLEVLARMAVVTLPVIIIYGLFLMFILMNKAEYSKIFPLFYTDIKSLFKGSYEAFFGFSGVETVLLLIPFIDKPKESDSGGVKAILLIIGFYLLVFFTTLNTFGIYQLKREIWPAVSIAKEVSFPSLYLENLEGVVLPLWVIVILASTGPVLHYASVYLKELFQVKEDKIFPILLAPLILLISLIPENFIMVQMGFGAILQYISIVLYVIVLPLALILAYIKRENKA